MIFLATIFIKVLKLISGKTKTIYMDVKYRNMFLQSRRNHTKYNLSFILPKLILCFYILALNEKHKSRNDYNASLQTSHDKELYSYEFLSFCDKNMFSDINMPLYALSRLKLRNHELFFRYLLLLSGDINLNPGPINNPCKVCQKSVKKKIIFCQKCNFWFHKKCELPTKIKYQELSSKVQSKPIYICKACLLNDHYILANLPTEQKFFNKLNNAINNEAFNLNNEDEHADDECECTINWKYYSVNDFECAKFNVDKTFSIFHLNKHSVELHIGELCIILEMLNFKFDFICLSESKIRNGFEPKINIDIEGYQTPIGVPTESMKGGVLIYPKIGLNYIPRNDLTNSMYKPNELESLFIEVINPSQTNSIIGVIYRHPCMNEKLFNEDYLKLLNDKLSSENKQSYISGDYNFDLLNVSAHNETFNFFDTMMANFLLPTITLPTKINTVKSTVIDNIFTNHLHPDMKTGNLTVGISDHLPSFLIVPKQNQNHLPKKHNLYTRNTKTFDRINFILDYLNINWDESLEAAKKDVNHSFGNFMSKINMLLDKYMPLKKISQKEFKRKFKPWISNEILCKIEYKNKIFKKYIKCKVADRKQQLNMEYKQIKNEITSLTRVGKKTYYEKYFSSNKKNLQKIWKGIKEIINIKSKNFDHPTSIFDGKKNITDPSEMANSFNGYFTSIADDILKNRKFEGHKSFRDYLTNPMNNSFFLYHCDNIEVKSIITSLNLHKAAGPNSIPTIILHLLKEEICTPLSNIFNLSFSTGQHPDLLKIAKTIPVFKKGSRLLVCNYRPISLLSNLNKILEKLFFSRLCKFLDEYKCIYSLQFGFRAKHSTNHALIDITENIRSALDNKKVSCGIFVDLQKAFDTVNHDILINKLNHYGIRGIANDWLSSYLSNRTQFVSILGFDSKTNFIHHGVPQGSMLGPLLFLIYINDLHCAIKFSKVYHFADDTNLLNINQSPKQMQKQVNIDLKSLYKWLLANKISLNCSKTELIFFHKPGEHQPNFDYRIKMNGHKIIPSDYIKYLGIYLDTKLTGKYHCDLLVKKLKRSNGVLSKSRHYVPPEELRSIYYAIFSSHLTYGCQVWGQSINTYTEKLFKLQNRAMRIISFSDFHANPQQIYKNYKIFQLKDFISLQNCMFIHNYLNNNLPTCFDTYFQLIKQVHSIDTRLSQLGCLFVPHYSTTKYGLNSITKKSIDSWNLLTKTFNCNLKTYSQADLKKKITSYFLDSY